METIVELTEYVRGKALSYVTETGETITEFPLSIVDFVIEHISQNCHFPSHFEEKNIVSDLSKGKNSLAMAANLGKSADVCHNGLVEHSLEFGHFIFHYIFILTYKSY